MLSVVKLIQKILQRIVLFFLGSTILAVLAYRFMPVAVTPLMVIRCFQQVGRGEKIRMKHHWVSLQEMSPYLPVAVMASEDQRFLNHHGFDFTEIHNALEERQSGKRFRGGSTISQQTAKNVFLWPTSSWIRKGLEVYFTGLIELCWSKERIMEVYLNSIEMGDGIYGAEAIAQQHFGRTASRLTRANCALIAATLPNPLKYSSKSPSKYMLHRQTAIMKQMKHINLFPIDISGKEATKANE
ncbi:MAG: monofunctional biosynthetic peptidoglycan transglycosylase [Clostridium sp.]|nr:monofunctional biosynthetic peptidoglycan transglycosylase [Clostridium sp.]